jgi:hypothetical protein
MATDQEQQKGLSLPNIPTGMPIGNLKIPKQFSDVKGQAKNMAENFIKDKAKMIAKQAAKKIATASLANPYVLAAIAIGIAILVVFLIIIAVVTGQGNSSSQNTTTSSTIDIYNPSPFTGNVDDYFTFNGGTQGQQDSLKSDLTIALAYPKYQTLLDINTKGKVVITLHAGSPTGYNNGWAVTNSPSGNIDLYGDFLSANPQTQKLYLLHETAHTIDFRNKLSTTFYTISKQDSSCYDPDGYIKTYPTGLHVGGNPVWESFADSFINTLFCRPGQKCGPNGGVSGQDGAIQDWPTTCVNTNNWMAINMLGVTKPSAEPGNPPPSANDCGGHYARTLTKNINQPNFQHTSSPNFGDPNCTLTSASDLDALYTLIQQLEPDKVRADSLFTCVAKYESSYNPNAFLGNSTSGAGAYGLYQMNPASHGGTSDVGDVEWRQQTANAINHISGYASIKAYWGVARSHDCPG